MDGLLGKGGDGGFARPSSSRGIDRSAGFNLAEIVVALSLLLTAGVMSTPPLREFLRRSKVESALQEASTLLRASRSIAITRGTPAVVFVDLGTRSLVAFADVHGEALADDPDGEFHPIPGQPQRRTDYEIGRVTMPPSVAFADPWGGADLDSIEGFANPGTLPAGSAIFLPDGSIEAPGAFRFRDERGNYLETIATPLTGVRVEIRKWDGEAWRSRGEGGHAWEWN
jgi:hypothetical protein